MEFEDIRKSIKKEEKSAYVCDRCDYAFKTSSALTKHKQRKTPCKKTVIENNININTNDETWKGEITEDLPKFNIDTLADPNLEGGFSAIFSASRRSGKTTLIKFLYSKFAKIFDFIVFFSDTLHNKNYSFVKEPKFNRFDGDILRDLYEFQRKTDNQFKILVIMDDCVSEKTRGSDAIMQLYLTGRNWNISCIISTQVSTLVSKKNRSNADFVFIGKTNSPENRMNLIESFLITTIKVPKEITTKTAKIEYIDKFMVEKTKDYNFIVLHFENMGGERVFTYRSPKGLH